MCRRCYVRAHARTRTLCACTHFRAKTKAFLILLSSGGRVVHTIHFKFLSIVAQMNLPIYDRFNPIFSVSFSVPFFLINPPPPPNWNHFGGQMDYNKKYVIQCLQHYTYTINTYTE